MCQLRDNNQGLIKIVTDAIPQRSRRGKPTVKNTSPSSALIDGRGHLGIVVLDRAAKLAANMAAAGGVGVVGTVNTARYCAHTIQPHRPLCAHPVPVCDVMCLLVAVALQYHRCTGLLRQRAGTPRHDLHRDGAVTGDGVPVWLIQALLWHQSHCNWYPYGPPQGACRV